MKLYKHKLLRVNDAQPTNPSLSHSLFLSTHLKGLDYSLQEGIQVEGGPAQQGEPWTDHLLYSLQVGSHQGTTQLRDLVPNTLVLLHKMLCERGGGKLILTISKEKSKGELEISNQKLMSTAKLVL